MMLVGYSRVSTDDQNMNLQLDALKKAGCEEMFSDKASGAKADRPGLKEALDYLRPDDVLVVWRFDRLGRSLKELITLADNFQQRGIGLKSLQEAIDTTSPGGMLVFQMFGAIAEFERGLIRERTKAGLASARKRGKFGGRPKALSAPKRRHAARLFQRREHSLDEICDLMNICKATLYKYVREFPEEIIQNPDHKP